MAYFSMDINNKFVVDPEASKIMKKVLSRYSLFPRIRFA